MKKADEILDDEELIETVYEALRRRHPQSASARWGFRPKTVFDLKPGIGSSKTSALTL
jgi:hypothetical protein